MVQSDVSLNEETRELSGTKLIGVSVVFAALAIILHPPFLPIGIPAPYAPFLVYEIWEIPLVIALLLYGIRVGIAVTFINFISLLVFFPGQLITGPIYNLTAIYAMMFGIYLPYHVLRDRGPVIVAWTSMIVGMTMRIGIMTIVNSATLPLPPPIGFSIPLTALPLTLVWIALFNGTVAAYTVPLAHVVASAVAKGTKITAWNRS